ncbi:kinase [Gardnerella sp. Marseille-Q2328]|uniref:kinase n=1 Tax=Gardnerella sp. Marseille-Q2328 TaxID=2759694 RepID=UPI00202402BB|nr:kinase [Gardnerella sp. Marseille-Q2328]
MEPRLGDIVLNRYVLVSLLRNEAGLQVWQANDRILTQDCQLFIVRDSRFLPEVNTIASTLALSHNRKFTQVLQLQHHDNIAIIITSLDRGVTLDDYLAKKDAPLSNEAVRTIVAETAQALSRLLANNITHHAIASDTVRITPTGIELADTPVSPLLEDRTQLEDEKHPPLMHDAEHTATRQLASLLYALLTRTSSRVQARFDAAMLPDNTPSEFRMICTRSLSNHKDGNGSNVVPMASIAELTALLGSYTPLSRLTKQDIDLDGKTSAASISNVRLRHTEDAFLLPLPEDLTQSEEQFEAQLIQQSNIHSDDVTATSESSSLTALATGTGSSAKLSNSIKNAGKTLGSLLKRNSANAKSDDNNGFEDDSNTNTDIDFHDIAAAEMANILAPTELDTGDAIFPTLSSSYKHFPDPATSRNVLDHASNSENQSAQSSISETGVTGTFDFEHLLAENAQHTTLLSRPQNLTSEGESTGRVPVVDTHGRFIAPGEESARALQDERNNDDDDSLANNAPSLPPSFQPREQAAASQKQKSRNNNAIADAKIWWGLSTKVIAIGAVFLLLVAGLALALHGLFGTHENTDGFGNNETWDSTNVENVPFGSQGVLPQEKQSTKKNAGRKQTGRKQVRAVPKPKMPTNTVAYKADRYQFLSFPAQQNGYGYYIHLTEPQPVYRLVVSIRTSGGHAYLIANATNDPTKGTQVAEFTFDESGTTDVKLKKIVKSQDFMLWVPKDSMPNNSLYINSIKLY